MAKAYIIYRQEHTEDREVRDKLQFLMNYCEAKNPATGSKYDANANVENKNIATLIGELPKQNFIRLNRRLLTDRLKEMYGKEVSDRYLELLDRHFIYKNDETSLANYCASITMYPWLLSGTTSIGGNSTRPTNLKSFCGGFVNMVFIVSSMLSGACATPEFLMYMNYFIAQEFGEDYYRRADEVVDLSRHRRTIDKVITDCFEQVVYSINQPTGARNFPGRLLEYRLLRPLLLRIALRRVPFPRRVAPPDWGGAVVVAETLHEVVQRRTAQNRAHLPRRDDGVADPRRRRDGRRVGRLHGPDVRRRTFVLHLHERQRRLAVVVLPPAQRDPRQRIQLHAGERAVSRPVRRAC